MQECSKYQPHRMFIESTAPAEITMSSIKTEAAIFKAKFGVKQHANVLHKQQLFGLRLRKTIFKWRHNRIIFCFKLQNWFYF